MVSNKEFFSLGEFITKMRKEKGYSQRKFAQISGLSNTTISRLENGETLHPDIETLKLLAEHLKIDEAALIKMVNSTKPIKHHKSNAKLIFLKQPVKKIHKYSSVFSAISQVDESMTPIQNTALTAEAHTEKASDKLNLKGMRLITLRLEKNITQKELAENLGIDKTLISQYEGEIIRPEYEIVKKLAEFFDVTIEYLCGTSDLPIEEKAVNNEPAKKEAVIHRTKPSELKSEYIALAQELQKANVNPNDIRAFINILNKYR